MSNTQATATKSADVTAREAEIVTAALAWGRGAGSFGDSYTQGRVVEALRAIGLGEHLPRESAEVTVHVTGTVSVRCDAEGNWTQEGALRALESAIYAGRVIPEVTEVETTGAPGAETLAE